jgi:hypothetical protein
VGKVNNILNKLMSLPRYTVSQVTRNKNTRTDRTDQIRTDVCHRFAIGLLCVCYRFAIVFTQEQFCHRFATVLP